MEKLATANPAVVLQLTRLPAKSSHLAISLSHTFISSLPFFSLSLFNSFGRSFELHTHFFSQIPNGASQGFDVSNKQDNASPLSLTFQGPFALLVHIFLFILPFLYFPLFLYLYFGVNC
jgi:hypothetical protein